MQGRLRKTIAILCLATLSTGSIGCWDKWEIEERGLVLALGIDEAPIEEVRDMSGVEGQLAEPYGHRALKVTYQFAIPASLSGEKSGGGPTYYNLTTTAYSSDLLLRGLAATRSSRKGTLEQLQVIVLGAEVAKSGIYPALERLVRDPTVRKQVPVYVTEDNVEELFNISTKQEAMPGLYLASLMRNQDWAHRIAPEMRIGRVFRMMREKAVYVIPRITQGKNDAKLAGAGIFHGERLVGWLGEEETRFFRWITNNVQIVPVVSATANKGQFIDGYLNERAHTIIRPEMEDGNIKLIIKIAAAGSILERQLEDDIWDEQVLSEVKEELSNVLARNVELVIKKAQEEWRLDIFGFGRYVERRYPKVWQEIKDQWHEVYFPGAFIEVDVDLTITRTGILR